MSTSLTTHGIGRRRFLQSASAFTVGGALLASARPAAAQDGTSLTEWFSNVSNYNGITDERGNARVTVTVGADGNGGWFAFSPPAVRVDPGTTVIWEWSGEGGLHNVVDKGGAYKSELFENAGSTFEHTFESEAVSTYVCGPHEVMGMKGAVIVGDINVIASPPQPEFTFATREPDYGDWFGDVDNFEGTADMRGQTEVRVQVGAEGNGGELAFSPPAIHVDPGTTVIWEWVGEGGPHNVVFKDGSQDSPSQSTGEWGLIFDGVGISKYTCEPHLAQGMKGAVVVGDVFEGVYELSPVSLSVLGGLGAALLSPFAFGAFLRIRGDRAARRKR